LATCNDVVYLDGIVGVGMVNSTINDLKKWDTSPRNNRLFSEKDFKEILKQDTLESGELNAYSFGGQLKKSDNDINMSHSGSWPEYVTYINRAMQAKNLIIILQNYDDGLLPIKAVKEVLNGKKISTYYNQEVVFNKEILDRLVREYVDEDDDNSITTLTLGNNALIFSSTNNPWDMPFYPDSATTFFTKNRMNIGFKFMESDRVYDWYLFRTEKRWELL